MKIVNLQQFLAMPNETLFSKYEPCFFHNLSIKTENCGKRDFFVQQLVDAIECGGSDDFFNKLEEAQINGVSLKMDFDCGGRDGCFEDDQLFAVWEKEDIEALINRLQKCIGN
jgi:hypothetical protein